MYYSLCMLSLCERRGRGKRKYLEREGVINFMSLNVFFFSYTLRFLLAAAVWKTNAKSSAVMLSMTTIS